MCWRVQHACNFYTTWRAMYFDQIAKVTPIQRPVPTAVPALTNVQSAHRAARGGCVRTHWHNGQVDNTILATRLPMRMRLVVSRCALLIA